MDAWQEIKEEIKRPVVVTNNINARSASGYMSHLWVADFVQMGDDGEFITFCGNMKVYGLTHFIEIDPPSKTAPHVCARCGEPNPDHVDFDGCRDPTCPENG